MPILADGNVFVFFVMRNIYVFRFFACLFFVFFCSDVCLFVVFVFVTTNPITLLALDATETTPRARGLPPAKHMNFNVRYSVP